MKNIIKTLFRSVGLDLVKHPYTDITSSLDYLKLLNNHQVDMVLDVGANVGQYASDLFKIGYKGKIVSFEPMSKEYEVLKKAAASNSNWIVAPQAAIGDYNGEVEINISENSVSSSILPLTDYVKQTAPETRYVSSEKVKIQPLSDAALPFIEKAERPFLKIDVQGYEEKVLLGAANIMPKLQGVHLEFSLKPLYENESSFEDMLRLVKSFGFEPCYFIPHHTTDSMGRLLQMDGVFYRR
jgi:FkbM family methyltransferase